MAVGQDLILRLASATRVDGITSGRYNLFKVFGVAAALSRALKLDVERTSHALGIAYGFACGEGQSAVDGSLAFRLQDGNAAHAALMATLLAERGYTGPREFLTGRMGFFSSFEPDPILERLTAELGRRWRGEEISIKPFAACRCTHTAIGLALEQHRLNPNLHESIEAVEIRVAPMVHKLVGADVDPQGVPPTQASAQFSLAYTVAVALVDGDAFLEQFSSQALARKDVLALARRITSVADPEMHDARFVTGRTRIEMHMRDGGARCVEGVEPPGNPSNPVSAEVLRDKFVKCLSEAQRPRHNDSDKDNVDADMLLSSILDMERADDVGALVHALR
jgi:2-methylcitrate dehydratase PrpD